MIAEPIALQRAFAQGGKMRILYFSVHEILEYDDLRMFTAQGHRVCSIGSYFNSTNNTFREQERPEFSWPEMAQAYLELGISREFVRLFDVVIFNHEISIFEANLSAFEGMPIVARTIGQSTALIESRLGIYGSKIKICRYSRNEAGLAGFAKTDAVIYFAKDLEDYHEWVGGGPGATFHNDYVARSEHSSPSCADYLRAIDGSSALLYSRNNETMPNAAGPRTFEEMRRIIQTCSFYFYVWSIRASYTLNLVETMLIGAPIIAPSAEFVTSRSGLLWTPNDGWMSGRYEVEALLSDPEAMIYSSIVEARSMIQLASEPCRKEAAGRIRQRARAMFDMSKIGSEWDDFLATL